MHPSPERLLDAALPQWDVTEQHARLVRAAPHAVWQALHEASMGDLPLTRALMTVRTLGRQSRHNPDRSMLDALPPGELARREPTELLLCLVLPTSLRIDVRAVADFRPVDLDDFHRPLPDGWVRIAMDFRLSPAGTSTRLATETRIQATGPRARRAFRAYWLVVGAGSGLVRRDLLHAVAARAESARA